MTQNIDVFVFDEFHPEDNAMMQALYSRSPRSVTEHVDKVKQVGSGKFMENFYIGYGHSSIGDCGSTTMYVENVSMLVAKAIQDNPLYSGQEASTRYLDYSKQGMVDPYNNDYTTNILNKWMEIYNRTLPLLMEAIKVQRPFDANEYKSEKVWEKAVAARAFDIARSLLPAGTKTFVSWHSNLRQARDRIRILSNHPLEEVREVAKTLFAELNTKYPNSFTGEEVNADSERYKERNEYLLANAVKDNYIGPNNAFSKLSEEDKQIVLDGKVAVNASLIDLDGLNNEEKEVISSRPKGALLPRRLGEYGAYKFTFLLDFGSYRDIQRHRNSHGRIPMITDRFGFGRWYKSEMEKLLSEEDFNQLWSDVEAQLEAIANIGEHIADNDLVRTQYIYPMGMECLVQLTYTLPQTTYVVDLRTSKHVHQSLREVIQDMGKKVQELQPELKLYADYEEDSWTAKRGEQDIVNKKTA